MGSSDLFRGILNQNKMPAEVVDALRIEMHRKIEANQVRDHLVEVVADVEDKAHHPVEKTQRNAQLLKSETDNM